MSNQELYHYGVLGMKWGVRRYQNPDGTLTAEGRKHYSKEYYNLSKKSTIYNKADTNRRKKQAIENTKKDAKYIADEKKWRESFDKANAKLYEKAEKEFKDGQDDGPFAQELGDKYVVEQEIWEEQYNKDRSRKEYAKLLVKDLKNDKYYSQAKKLSDKYKLYEYDELAAVNHFNEKALNEYINGDISYNEYAYRIKGKI